MKRDFQHTDIQVFAQGLLAGEEAAFDAIYSASSRKVYQVAFRILNSEEDALEVVQETFLKLWLKRSELDPSKSLEGYLSAIARNYALKLLSGRIQLSFLDQLPDFLHAESADQPLLKDEFQERIRRAVDALPPRAKEILLLSREQGLSNGQIAERLGLSLSTVNNHIHLALSRVRQHLQIPLTLLLCLMGQVPESGIAII